MARTLVIKSVKAAGRTFNVNKKLQIAPTLKKFMINFRRPSGYQGKYGFDWLRDEYIYPIETVTNDNNGTAINAPTALCKNVAAIKTEYKTTDVVNPISPYGKEYYPAWLSILPHTTTLQFKHGSSMHKNGVNLDLEIEELESLTSDATEILFECNDNNVIITPKKLKLKDLIDLKAGPKTKKLGGTTTRDYHLTTNKVNIKNTKSPLKGHEEIKVFAKLGTQKEEVGKLMLYKNDIIPKAEIVAVNVLIGGIGGKLRNDYEFIFKKQSFNQAQIRAEVKVDTKFDINRLPTTDANVANFISDYSGGTLPSGKSTSDFTKELILLYDTYGNHKPSGGKIDTNINKRTYLFFTNFKAGSTNGICSADFNKDAAGNTISIDWGNAYIVFDSGSNSKRTFIHECGHSFSLPHIFMEAGGKLKVSSSHIFHRGYTDNYMDYEWQIGARAPSGGYYSSGDNKYKGKMYSLFKWQWNIIRNDESLITNY